MSFFEGQTPSWIQQGREQSYEQSQGAWAHECRVEQEPGLIFNQGEARQYLVLSMCSPLQRSSKVSQALLTAPRL